MHTCCQLQVLRQLVVKHLDYFAPGITSPKLPLLSMWSKADFKQLVAEKMVAYEREHRELDIVLFDQVLIKPLCSMLLT